MTKKHLILIVIAIVAGLIGSLTYMLFAQKNTDEASVTHTVQTFDEYHDPETEALESTEARDDTLTIAAVGDMLAHDSVIVNAQTDNGYDFQRYFTEVKDILRQNDVVYCNQEGSSAGEALGIAGYPSFNAPQQFAADLAAVGCNTINLANNHLYDRGQAGIDATLTAWDQLSPLAVSGANRSVTEQKTVRYFEIEGVRFAFIAFTDLSNVTPDSPHSINFFEASLVESLATEAATHADVVIASAHWGIEDSSSVSQEQEYWANQLANYGVDIIFGAGPHVLQPVEIITKDNHETVVFYSLGNFLSTQLEIDQLIGGIAQLTLSKADYSVTDISFTPTYMHYEWTADQAAREELLARHNLLLYPLSQAGEALGRSLFDTTVAAQLKRVEALLNQRTTITITD